VIINSADKPDGYLLGSCRIATAPEPNSSRLTSFRSTHFDSPANNVGQWPASLGCTTNSYSFPPAPAAETPPTSFRKSPGEEQGIGLGEVFHRVSM
jgi:hypothetical protein